MLSRRRSFDELAETTRVATAEQMSLVEAERSLSRIRRVDGFRPLPGHEDETVDPPARPVSGRWAPPPPPSAVVSWPTRKRRAPGSSSVGLALVDVFLAFAFFYWLSSLR